MQSFGFFGVQLSLFYVNVFVASSGEPLFHIHSIYPKFLILVANTHHYSNACIQLYITILWLMTFLNNKKKQYICVYRGHTMHTTTLTIPNISGRCCNKHFSISLKHFKQLQFLCVTNSKLWKNRSY